VCTFTEDAEHIAKSVSSDHRLNPQRSTQIGMITDYIIAETADRVTFEIRVNFEF
jgi:tRNA threonylcarbamoyladenosine modification (KEOPS) complex  Pcc1 subunit